jgi:3-deoxy-D-manno-octulosonic-acid transferase
MWPNLLRAARRRGVAVAVVNARLSPRSFRRYARVSALARAFLFRYVDRIAVQSEEYADRFRALGVEASKLVATGSVKYDGAVGNRDSEKAGQLRGLLFGREPKPGEILVAGSTHAPEEAIVLRTFRRLRARFPALRLILVPRHPDRFEEVARLVESTGFAFVRRSQIEAALVDCPPVILLDSVGELGAAWALADIGYVGGTLDGRRGGQSMIEPAGYGVPTVFGPHVWNFRDAAARLVEAGGAVMVKVETELDGVLARLITDKDERTAMGTAARDLVRRQQGATERTLDVLHGLMGESVLLPRAG